MTLDIGTLQRDKLVTAGLHASGSLSWTTVTGQTRASAAFEVNTVTMAPAGSWLRLRYAKRLAGVEGDDRIRLTTAPLPWGAVRWSFLCPGCGRTCRKLHLPDAGDRFACRICWGLTYTSSQESHRFAALFRRLNIDRRDAWVLF